MEPLTRASSDLKALSELSYEILLKLTDAQDRLTRHVCGLLAEATQNLSAAATIAKGGDAD